MSVSRIEGAVGYASVTIVLAGILWAWTDPVSGHLLHASALLLAVIAILLGSVRLQILRSHWLILLPLACALWGAVQVVLSWTVYPYETWNSATAWLARSALFAAAYIGFRNRERRESLHTSLIIFGGTFSLLTLLQWYGGPGTILWLFSTGYDSEIAGTFLNRGQYAAFIALLLPVVLARTLKTGGPVLPYALCAGVMFASVIASASRAGAIIVIIETFIFLAIACRSRYANYGTAALVTAALFACTLIGGWKTVWDRFAAGNPFAYRIEMLTSSVEMIRSRPLTGFGLGTWPSVYPAFAVFDPPRVYMNHAHNDWAEWAAEGGIIFVVLVAILACTATWFARRHTWALGIPAVFAHALVDFPLQKPALACSVFLFLGLLAAAASERHSTASSEDSFPPAL